MYVVEIKEVKYDFFFQPPQHNAMQFCTIIPHDNNTNIFTLDFRLNTALTQYCCFFRTHHVRSAISFYVFTVAVQ